MNADPIVTWYVVPSGVCKLFVHGGDTLRVFTAPNYEKAQKMLAAVLIDAFKMAQPDAQAFAASAVKAQQEEAELPATLQDHVALLQEQLTDTQDEAAEARKDLAASNATIAAHETTIADQEKTITSLQAELSTAKAAAAPPPSQPSETSTVSGATGPSGTGSPSKFPEGMPKVIEPTGPSGPVLVHDASAPAGEAHG